MDTNNDGSISVSEAAEVSCLNLSNCDISELSGIEYFINLDTLVCCGNPISSLDLSNNTLLKYLDCSGIPITTLDVSHNLYLWNLSCRGTQLMTVDVSKLSELQVFDCSYNQISSLDMSNNTA